MQIEYKNNRIEKICTSIHEAEIKHDKEMAENQVACIMEIVDYH